MTITSASNVGNYSDSVYHDYIERINLTFAKRVANGQKLFTTDVEDLFSVFLDALPQDNRQYHNCSCCRQFINRFGSLVFIDDNGLTQSAVWDMDDTPEYYQQAVYAMLHKARKAKVIGVFMSSEKMWGTPVTGVWKHYAIKPPKDILYTGVVLTAGQKMAEKREDFKTVMYALNEFTQPMLEQALVLLKTDSLYRSEKVLGQAQWLYDLHVARTQAAPGLKSNVVWKAVASAPAGFCHPRSSMIGTLLEDIAAGMDFESVSRRFKEKMHPLSYQRPQAAPAAGAIAQAEKIVEQLGVSNSLKRRFARLEEIQTIWTPKVTQEKKTSGVFGHLQAKNDTTLKPMTVPAGKITFARFVETVLPTADSMEFYVANRRESLGALVTADDADAPPILQWDQPEQRNPFSMYVYSGGSYPSHWNLGLGGYVKVNAISHRPSQWFGEYANQNQGVVFVLDGARETRKSGLALFPEDLKAEFHGIRSVIEAYSAKGEIAGMLEGTACGIFLDKGREWNHIVRVTTAGHTIEYKLDRWN